MTTEKISYKLIDDFLPTDEFRKIHDLLIPSLEEHRKNWYGSDDEGVYVNRNTGKPLSIPKPLPWLYVPNPSKVKSYFNKENKSRKNLFYFTHPVYKISVVSPFFNMIMPHCKPLDIKSLMRIKINMYPNTEIIHEHGMHSDFPFSHKSALLSINTCDGYTKLEDGTKIDSVANRMLLFDASKLHTSSTCTDQSVRVNINFNYF
tara:strand:+ start:58 stop:669 length:612 start_codon:yes stop_codon:yes gene_type:complete